MAVFIRLEQSKFNDERNGKRWHARTVSTGEVSTRELAAAIQQNTTFKKSEVRGLIDELVEVMAQEMKQGRTVVLNGLGRFRLSVESDTVEKADDFDIKKHIKSVRCKFVPEGKRTQSGTKKVENMAEGVDVAWYGGERQTGLKGRNEE